MGMPLVESSRDPFLQRQIIRLKLPEYQGDERKVEKKSWRDWRPQSVRGAYSHACILLCYLSRMSKHASPIEASLASQLHKVIMLRSSCYEKAQSDKFAARHSPERRPFPTPDL